MNIAIDITPLSSGHAVRGVGVYTKNLINALQQYESKHSYSFFTRGENIPKDAEIVHYPYFDPFFLTLPWKAPISTVVTVHDLIPLVFPDHFKAGFRGRVKWNMQLYALQRVDGIITVSNCSKQDVMRITKIPEQNIHAVYSAATPGYGPGIGSKAKEQLGKKYTLPEKFMVYVGDVNWNKNVLGLLQAFVTFSTTHKETHLLLVGSAFVQTSLHEASEIQAAIQTLGLGDRVHCTGFVSQEDLVGLYTLAECLVEPSFYEGFGLPVLEAMASGCPVVVANNSSLKEIAGPSIKMDAENTQSMVDAMQQVAELTGAERKKLIQDGIVWAKQFSWEKTAHETVSVYEKVLAKK